MNQKNIEAIYPLSPMQHALLFHSLYDQAASEYFQQLRLEIRGGLDLTAFRRAWQALIERHSVLRTAVVWQRAGEPLQVVLQQVDMPWEQHDWRDLPPTEQQQRLRSFMEADRLRGFELTKAPLMRLAIMQTDQEEYQLIWSNHHMILDGWSRALLFSELLESYQELARGVTPAPAPSRPYRDFIVWLQQQDKTEAELYWSDQLKDFSGPTLLGLERKFLSSDVPDEYIRHELSLTTEATARLVSFAKENHLTLSTVVQGAWTILINRYSGEDNVVFGWTTSGRSAPLDGIEKMVGLFINTLPVPVRVQGALKVTDWLKKLQRHFVDLQEHEHSSLTDVERWTQIPKGTHFFERIFVFENAKLSEANTVFDSIRIVDHYEKTNYPLTAVAVPGPNLLLSISHSSRYFKGTEIERFLEHFKVILETIVQSPEKQIADICLVNDEERRKILKDWSGRRSDYPSAKTIAQLFEEQVTRASDSVAVKLGDEQITYGELNRRANQLARHLQKLGVGPEKLVGISMERSIELIVALVAILKAGGAYVPLDPEYPQERLCSMVRDASVDTLLTQKRLLDKLQLNVENTIAVDGAWESFAPADSQNFESGCDPDNIAYVIFTSGSTGRPKTTAITQRSVIRLVKETNYARFGPEETFLQFAPISFDASTFEIWGSLLNGARLVIMPAGLASLMELGREIRLQDVTTLWLTAGLFQQMVDSQLPDLIGLRQLLAGGDVLSISHVERAARELPDCQLINGYGPTENTTFSCCYGIKRGERFQSSVPIGFPIANSSAYILDGTMRLVPVGVAGELFLGGDGLARGYANDVALTAEKFVPDPFSNNPGERLYRTGDRARFLEDGSIEFLGRIDQQVKIRGYRIEPAEVSFALLRHPSIQACVVTVAQDSSAQKRLIAYTVSSDSLPLSAEELITFLRKSLPEYMIPRVFISVDKLPLTANGKIDFRKLPKPEPFSAISNETFVAPQTEVQTVLANIWSTVLGLPEIGVFDNFFDLGGHSLLATQVIARVRQSFNVELPLRALFDSPTVASFCESIEKAKQVAGETTIEPISLAARPARRAIKSEDGQFLRN